jgi:two-component system sensor histidine kinase VicK
MFISMDHSVLQFSSDQLLEILAQAPDATAIYSGEQLIIQTANDAMISFWGKTRSVIGMPLEEAVPELRGQPFIPILQDVWRRGETYQSRDAEARLMVDGRMQTFYFDFTYFPLRNARGEVYCILHTASNVTAYYMSRMALQKSRDNESDLLEEQQVMNEKLLAINTELQAAMMEQVETNQYLAETQDALRALVIKHAESEGRFRFMVQQAPVAICILTGRRLEIESANDMMLGILGKTSDIIGKRFSRVLPELGGQPFLDQLERVYLTGETYYGKEAAAIIEHKGQLTRGYFDFIYKPLLDGNQRTTSIMIVAVEVTAQVNARKELQKTEEQLRFAIEAANVGTWFINGHTNEFIPSVRLKEMFGYMADEEMPFDAAINQIHEDYRKKVIRAVEATIKKGKPFNIEYPVTGYHDDKLRWVRAYGKHEQDITGGSPHFSGIMIDITEQKMDDIRKNDFIGMVSHELKTPLTSLKGYVQILGSKARKQEDSFMSNALQKAELQVNKMSSLINGFLNVSRLESGKIILDKQYFQLDKIVKEVIGDTVMTTTSHTITLHPCGPFTIYADQDKIAAVVSNLLSNAVKYSPGGKNIELTCRLNRNMVELSVTDKGMGIREEDIEKLFERYYRVENKLTKDISGFGIGLYLSAEIIAHHDGKIWVESEPGKGSTFYFSLPLAAQ